MNAAHSVKVRTWNAATGSSKILLVRVRTPLGDNNRLLSLVFGIRNLPAGPHAIKKPPISKRSVVENLNEYLRA